VSGQHATIRWSGSQWQVRDLGSKNGTFVRGRRIDAGAWTALSAGDEVGFGRLEEPWRLDDDSPPSAMAWRGDEAILCEDDLLALPSPSDPRVCVYRAEHGAWVAEDDSGVRHVQDGEKLEVQGQLFVLDLPHVMPATRDMHAGTLSDAALHFAVSRDQEHITIDLLLGGRSMRLPHRAHHELLLYLARARMEDASTLTAPMNEHGWRYQDEAARDLRIPPSHFNMTIYRARQQLRKQGFEDADAILERRRGSGQIRIGVHDLRIDD
jgi:hypothetical protein